MAHSRVAAAALSAVLAVGCGGSKGAPAQPTPPAPSVSGTWTGAFDVTSCAGSCTSPTDAFALRLDSAGHGVLQLDTSLFQEAPAIPVDVSYAQTDGTVVVTGAAPARRGISVQLTLTDIGTTLQGTARYSLLAWNGLTSTKEARVLFADGNRTSRAGRFEGDWQGYLSRTSCAGDCTAPDGMAGEAGLRLILSQSGETIAGTANGVELRGTTDSASLRATASYAAPGGGCAPNFDGGYAPCRFDAYFVAWADALDRLHGTVTYRDSGLDPSDQPYSYDATASLDGLVRWP